jgi:hypothetical protein
MKKSTLFAILLGLILGVAGSWSAAAYDRTEVEACGGCHFYPGSVVMQFTTGTWLESNHAFSNHGFNSNTYCAGCHSPFQADAAATRDDNDPVPLDEWEAVTCASCHPPHDLRVEWGTPIGTYDVETGDWSPVYEEEADELCRHCHKGSRHAGIEFQAFGNVMSEHKGVRCIDCHMPKVQNTLDADRMTRSHDFLVGANLPYSCGTNAGGCHANHKESWAAKQILKGKIHGKMKTH